MGKKMKHAPVYFTIVQARFNQILALESYAPQIQDHLRKQGFPDAKKGALTTVNLTPTMPSEGTPSQVPVIQTPRYNFSNMNQSSCFILDQGALTFQTTDYDSFNKFSSDFMNGLESVHKAVELSYTERIGIRYLDAVFPKHGEKLSDYLIGSVLGLAEIYDTNIVHSFSETLLKMSDVNIVSRTIVQNGSVGFPPDLLPINIKINDRFQKLQGKHAILDTDGSVAQREVLNLERIQERLYSIHEEIVKAFRSVITEKALSVWG